MLEEEMKRIAAKKVIAQKGRINSEDLKEIERQVKSEMQNKIYFPTLVRVHGTTVQFSVPDSFLGSKADREWSYCAGVTISSVMEVVSNSGNLLKNSASDVLQEPAYVDLIVPVESTEEFR